MPNPLPGPPLGKLLSLGAVLLFLALAVHQAGKPLHLDSMDFPAVAKATAETGKPIYYRGEGNPRHNGLFHPPLYIYSLAAWFKVFGAGATQARLFGAACVLLFGWTTLLLAGTLLTRAELARAAPWFWAIFLLNPYTLQCSAVPDIDTTIYGPLLTLLLWSVLRLSWHEGVRRTLPPTGPRLLLVSALVALCLWAKLTTVLAFFPFLLLLAPKDWGWSRALAFVGLATVAGVFAFFVTYFAFGGLLGLDVRYTFAFLAQSFAQRGHLPSPIANFAYMGSRMARWSGFLPWLACAVLGASAAPALLRRRDDRARPAAILLLLHGAITLYYCARALTFGEAPFKYVFVSFGAAAMALAYWVSEWRSRAAQPETPETREEIPAPAPVRWGVAVSLAGAACALAGLYLGAAQVADTVIVDGWHGLKGLLLALPLALALIGLAFHAFRRTAGRVVVLAAACLQIGLQLGVALYQSHVSYSTTYDYGQRGLAAAAAFVRARTDPDDLVSSMKDFGFLAERPYVENYGALFSDDEARHLIEYWEVRRVPFIVFTEGIGQDSLAGRPLLIDWIARNASLVGSFGHYRIYQPRHIRPKPQSGPGITKQG